MESVSFWLFARPAAEKTPKLTKKKLKKKKYGYFDMKSVEKTIHFIEKINYFDIKKKSNSKNQLFRDEK